MAKQHAPGTRRADPDKLSIAALPYEIQVAIFKAAMGPQVFFMNIKNNTMAFTRPADKALGLACQLSREVYLKHKTLHRFGNQYHWVDRENDIFYLYRDDPVPRLNRPSTRDDAGQLEGDEFEVPLIQNVAVDLQYLGVHPRTDPIIRIWTIFPSLRRIHIFVPKGPPQTPALTAATPDTLVLAHIPTTQVVAAPGHDDELWLAVRYQVKKACMRILGTENGWHGRSMPEVVGHLTDLRGARGIAEL